MKRSCRRQGAYQKRWLGISNALQSIVQGVRQQVLETLVLMQHRVDKTGSRGHEHLAPLPQHRAVPADLQQHASMLTSRTRSSLKEAEASR